VHGLAFHPDGRRILSGGLDGAVKVWDTATSRPVVFRGHSSHVTYLGLHEDGRHVISKGLRDYSSKDLETKVWGLEDGEEDRSIPAPERDGARIDTHTEAEGSSLSRLSPDGTMLAEVRQGPGLAGCDVDVTDVASGRRVFTLKGHTLWVGDVVFSPDGTRLATASLDGTVKLWDATTGQEVLTLRGHTAGVMVVAFSTGDGMRLISGGIDTLAIVWDARPLPEGIFHEAKAHRLVQYRLASWPRKGELIAQLRAEVGLDEPTRVAALRIAERLADRPQPRRLLGASWEVVRSSGRDPRDYTRALQWAEEGSRLDSGGGPVILTFLGAAYYRAGRLQDALDAFDRAESPDAGPSSFVQSRGAFRAMTLHLLGRRDEASSQLGRLRRQFQESPWDFHESRTLLREAGALIDSQAAGTATGARPAHQDGSH
jgi:eukaryotic-like serine/threonine-protein kinase